MTIEYREEHLINSGLRNKFQYFVIFSVLAVSKVVATADVLLTSHSIVTQMVVLGVYGLLKGGRPVSETSG